MSKRILVPKYASFFPSEAQRDHAAQINAQYPMSLFENEHDWFFFFHIDPAVRILHATGMNVGVIFFAWAILEWSLYSIPLWGIGVFFFYYLGVITHIIYDRQSAPVERRHLVTTFWTVIVINLKTTFGLYDRELRRFINKYPFTVNAHSLFEIERSSLLKFLCSIRNLSSLSHK